MRYAHTNIISPDWRKLADFYINVFNCKILAPTRQQQGDWLSRGTGVKNASLEGAHLLLPGYGSNGPTLEIYQYQHTLPLPEVEPNQRGFGHLAFEVEHVENVVEKLESQGGTSNGEVTVREIKGIGTITFVYARDPDGNLIEIQNWSDR